MKKYLTLVLLIVAIGAHAQTVKIKSRSALADSIYINRGAVEVVPFVTGADSTMIRSMDYTFNPRRDTLQNFNVEVRLYDNNAKYVQSSFFSVPGNLFLKWQAIITKIDNYVTKKRLVKQN
jgi:hypothetical protein